jgi:hypothetical protein
LIDVACILAITLGLGLSLGLGLDLILGPGAVFSREPNPLFWQLAFAVGSDTE